MSGAPAISATGTQPAWIWRSTQAAARSASSSASARVVRGDVAQRCIGLGCGSGFLKVVLSRASRSGRRTETLQHHQRIHCSAHTGLKQHISGVARCQHPFQRQAGYQGFVVQALPSSVVASRAAGLIAPGGAALGGSSHHRSQLGCGLCKGVASTSRRRPAHALEQRPCRQGVTRHVARKVITRGLRTLQLPAQLRVVSKRRANPAETAAPRNAGPKASTGRRAPAPRCARQMRALGLRMELPPGPERGAILGSARSGVPITFAMTVIASRDQATPVNVELVSVTMPEL